MLIRRGLAAGLAGAALLAAGASTAWWASPTLARALDGLSSRVLFRVETGDSLVALTLDDGPTSATPPMLDLLARHDARATFFLLARRAGEREGTVRRIVEEGHELGNHLVRDRPTWTLSRGEVERALDRADSVLSRHGDARWVRPGGGWVDDDLLAAARERGLRVALGSVYPFDAWLSRPGVLAGFVLRKARPGSVIVLHDGPGRGRVTVEVLRRVLPGLRARGYRVVTLGRLTKAGRGTAGTPGTDTVPGGRRGAAGPAAAGAGAAR